MENLKDYQLGPDPFVNFLNWFEEAKRLEANPEAMSVATFDSQKKRPATRYVLYKGMQEKQIVFYTNYASPKSHDLEKNPEIALAFYWHHCQKQIRIQGRVQRMSREQSMHYFHSRDRDSQIASYLSHQSAPIKDKQELLDRFREVDLEFKDQKIPLPREWGGFLISPYEFEFFLYGKHRLNDRFLFELTHQSWHITRLQP